MGPQAILSKIICFKFNAETPNETFLRILFESSSSLEKLSCHSPILSVIECIPMLKNLKHLSLNYEPKLQTILKRCPNLNRLSINSSDPSLVIDLSKNPRLKLIKIRCPSPNFGIVKNMAFIFGKNNVCSISIRSDFDGCSTLCWWSTERAKELFESIKAIRNVHFRIKGVNLEKKYAIVYLIARMGTFSDKEIKAML